MSGSAGFVLGVVFTLIAAAATVGVTVAAALTEPPDVEPYSD